MAIEDGWYRDPYGVHEERYFFFGTATHRVRDAGVESEDAPPRGDERPAEQLSEPAIRPTGRQLPPGPGRRPSGQEITGTGDFFSDWSARESGPADELFGPADEDVKVKPSSRVLLQQARRSGRSAARRLARAGRPALSRAAQWRRPVLSPTARWRAVGVVVVAAVVVAVLVGVLPPSHSSNGLASARTPSTKPSGHSGVHQTTTSTTTTSTTTTSTTTSTTTTTQAVPSSPRPSADQAANALISAWAAGSQPQALAVATPAAVASLFANHYQSGLVTDRGCNTESPATCSFGPYGGASPSDPLYSITVTQAASGWYVSAVLVEG